MNNIEQFHAESQHWAVSYEFEQHRAVSLWIMRLLQTQKAMMARASIQPRFRAREVVQALEPSHKME